jgi:hypothetical protein
MQDDIQDYMKILKWKFTLNTNKNQILKIIIEFINTYENKWYLVKINTSNIYTYIHFIGLLFAYNNKKYAVKIKTFNINIYLYNLYRDVYKIIVKFIDTYNYKKYSVKINTSNNYMSIHFI